MGWETCGCEEGQGNNITMFFECLLLTGLKSKQGSSRGTCCWLITNTNPLFFILARLKENGKLSHNNCIKEEGSRENAH